MSENFFPEGMAVPIKVNRVFDSCSDRDCMTNVMVTLTSGSIAPNVTQVKTKCVSISDVCITVEAVLFNCSFYEMDLTYTFEVTLLAYVRACETPTTLTCTATASKSCILYGSEANTQTFFSNGDSSGATTPCCDIVNAPNASVQVVQPIALETKLCNPHPCPIPCCPETDANGQPRLMSRQVVLTLGVFSIVELTRPVTILVPTFPYTVPQKECSCNTDSPCEVFSRIQFPTEEFAPTTLENSTECGSACGCGCNCES